VPADQIAENLAFINWTILSGVAAGAFGAVVVLRLRSQATTGYLGFTALTAAAFGALAWLSDGVLPASDWGSPRRLALALFTILAVAMAFAVGRGGRGVLVGAAGSIAATAALAFGALDWGGTPVGALLLLIQLVVLAAATGGVWAAMILGHWYLVTPKLPEAPLVLFSRLLLWVVGLQLVLSLVWLAAGAGPAAAGGFADLTGPWAMFVWLRLLVGLLLPLVVSWAAIQTARSRSMESATGLLYVNVGAIASGTILAAGLYFGAGLLV